MSGLRWQPPSNRSRKHESGRGRGEAQLVLYSSAEVGSDPTMSPEPRTCLTAARYREREALFSARSLAVPTDGRAARGRKCRTCRGGEGVGGLGGDASRGGASAAPFRRRLCMVMDGRELNTAPLVVSDPRAEQGQLQSVAEPGFGGATSLQSEMGSRSGRETQRWAAAPTMTPPRSFQRVGATTSASRPRPPSRLARATGRGPRRAPPASPSRSGGRRPCPSLCRRSPPRGRRGCGCAAAAPPPPAPSRRRGDPSRGRGGGGGGAGGARGWGCAAGESRRRGGRRAGHRRPGHRGWRRGRPHPGERAKGPGRRGRGRP